MNCEHCSNEIPGVEDAHSMLIVLQKVGQNGYSWYQCEQGGYVDGHSFQHWHCSKEEMVSGVKICLNDHHMEQLLQSVPSNQVRLHVHVLNAGLLCWMCHKPLDEHAYRFCLTVATPQNKIIGESHSSIGDWCCSLEHARAYAIKYLDEELLQDATIG